MKITQKFILLFVIIFLNSYTLIAQNQSFFLPIPGDMEPSPLGSKMINFTDMNNPGISDLPSFIFSPTPNVTGDPHTESHLQAVASLMNEKYLGQHPMFAQQVVHDAAGNLLFFIVDNNIYNKNGVAFFKYDESGQYPNNVLSYLHDGPINTSVLPNPSIYNEWPDWVIDDPYTSILTRFSVDGNQILLDPEIVVIPLSDDEECNRR